MKRLKQLNYLISKFNLTVGQPIEIMKWYEVGYHEMGLTSECL